MVLPRVRRLPRRQSVGTGIARYDDGVYIRLSQLGAALAILDHQGRIIDASPAAQRLFGRFRLSLIANAQLPDELGRELARAPFGEAIMWRAAELDAVLGCTRYALGDEHALLLIREITEQQRALSRRLHQQRLESTGKLVAHIAHDLRAPLSSIVYNADCLHKRATELAPEVRELVHDIELAADQLRRSIAGLLDYVRLGPPVHETLYLRDIIERVASLLRAVFRAGNHQLSVELHDDTVCVSGNPIAIEQIVMNLLVNSTESAGGASVNVRIRTERVAARTTSSSWRSIDEMVRIEVSDDGPGVPLDRRHAVFEPFVTSKPEGIGLGLTVAREAATAFGGQLTLEDSAKGACFALVLPVARMATEAHL